MSPHDHRTTEARFGALHDGDLDPLERAVLERELAACAPCTEAWQRYTTAVGALRLPPAATVTPAAHVAAVLARVAAQRAAGAPPVALVRPRPAPWAPRTALTHVAALAAGALAVWALRAPARVEDGAAPSGNDPGALVGAGAGPNGAHASPSAAAGAGSLAAADPAARPRARVAPWLVLPIPVPTSAPTRDVVPAPSEPSAEALAALRASVAAELRPELEAAVRAELTPVLQRELTAALSAELTAELSERLRAELVGPLRDELRAQVVADVRRELQMELALRDDAEARRASAAALAGSFARLGAALAAAAPSAAPAVSPAISPALAAGPTAERDPNAARGPRLVAGPRPGPLERDRAHGAAARAGGEAALTSDAGEPVTIRREGGLVVLGTSGSFDEVVPALLARLDDPDSGVRIAVEQRLADIAAELGVARQRGAVGQGEPWWRSDRGQAADSAAVRADRRRGPGGESWPEWWSRARAVAGL